MKEGKFRVSRVTTRTGDKGETSLADGTRLPKSAAQFELLGDLDELNATIGVLVSLQPGEDYLTYLFEVQQTLFNIGAEVAAPGHFILEAMHVARLEEQCEALRADLPPLREFVLPGGTPAGAQCHVCRTVVRRTERAAVAVHQQTAVNPHSLAWLNRLSDYFFIVSRRINLAAYPDEPQWTGVKKD